MRDQFELDMEDSELMSEVQLLAALIATANEHDGRLTDQVVDATLGLVSQASTAT